MGSPSFERLREWMKSVAPACTSVVCARYKEDHHPSMAPGKNTSASVSGDAACVDSVWAEGPEVIQKAEDRVKGVNCPARDAKFGRASSRTSAIEI